MRHVLVGFALACAVGCDDPDRPVELPCDITQADCQAAVFAFTARARGDDDAELPPIRVITRQALRDEIAASLTGAPPSAEEVALQQAYALIGVLPAEMGAANEALADDLAEGIAAYYQPADAAITIIEDSAESKDDGTYVLSHEFVHALQHQRGDLGRPASVTTTDASTAFDSLVEGEAVWLSNLTMANIEGRELEAGAVEDYFDRLTDAVLEDIGETEAPLYLASEILPYPLGGRGVYHAYSSDGLPGIEDLHANEPERMNFWVTEETPSSERITCDLPEAPEGFGLLERDRWGVVGLVAIEAGLARTPTLAQSWMWSDDAVGVYVNADLSQVVLRYRVRFGTESQASEIAALLSSPSLATLLVEQVGSEVQVTGSNTLALAMEFDALVAPCTPPGEATAADNALTRSGLRRRRLPFMR